jgi:hypothetical protein
VFPLKYYPSKKHIRTYFTKCNRKFLFIIDVYLYKYKGKAFYIKKEQVVKMFIKSRVVIDAAYFREDNPNYTKPSIKESDKGLLLI